MGDIADQDIAFNSDRQKFGLEMIHCAQSVVQECGFDVWMVQRFFLPFSGKGLRLSFWAPIGGNPGALKIQGGQGQKRFLPLWQTGYAAVPFVLQGLGKGGAGQCFWSGGAIIKLLRNDVAIF